MKKKYLVKLSESELRKLEILVQKGKAGARAIRRAHMLMLVHEGKKDEEIASATKSHFMTVQKVRERFNKEGLAGVLKEKKRSGRPEKLQGKEKAHLIALACSNAPEGRALWTLRLLADQCVSLDLVESISHETIRTILKKTK